MFKSIGDYVAQLLRYLTRPDRFPSIGELHEGLLALKETDQLLEGIRAFLEFDLETVCNTPANGMLLLLMSGKPGYTTSAGLRALYHSVDKNLSPVLEEVMMAWNREPTPPFTSIDLAVLFNAVIDGWMLRARFDPDRASPKLYCQAVLCLLPMVTRQRGESITVEERLAVFNSYSKDSADKGMSKEDGVHAQGLD